MIKGINILDANASTLNMSQFWTLKSPLSYSSLYKEQRKALWSDDQRQGIGRFYIKKSPVINILAWTIHHGAPEHEGMSPFNKCPIFRNCNITNDKSLLDNTEYLLFHVSNINSQILPPYQKPNQKWIMHTKEPPTRWYFKKVLLVKDHINFTMSYWTGSDIFVPYGWVIHNETKHLDPSHQIPKSIFETRTGVVAWLVSHCDTPSEREDYVAELAEYIQVDIYGKCGKPCPRKKECLEMIGNKYKFYIAFENSDCEGYITEKVWRNAFKYKLVPIVKGTQATFSKYLPPKSFIHVDEFSTIKDLAYHLEFLNTNSDEYMKYLEWTMYFDVKTYNKCLFFCNICRLCNYYEGRTHTTNLEYWTNVTSHCSLSESYYDKNESPKDS
ncbi:unnamed protein product [Owenia fusiformis]|uniref:Fucosyltransferase n=1 Tax=Owenia fusiformis TaxID=6347 RepID=A0A8S4PXF3_OWEFU|nr:unnamed protein product [Owenia fusiformis]